METVSSPVLLWQDKWC